MSSNCQVKQEGPTAGVYLQKGMVRFFKSRMSRYGFIADGVASRILIE
jgi:hypothetical protein